MFEENDFLTKLLKVLLVIFAVGIGYYAFTIILVILGLFSPFLAYVFVLIVIILLVKVIISLLKKKKD